jgi:RimJ/RimL family protein N-acetyltransferase
VDEQIALRPLAVTDATVMATVLADSGLYAFTGGEPPTEDELTRLYQVQTRGHSPDGTEQWLNLVVLLGADRTPIGYVQATIPADGGPTEVAWVIGRPWQGHGYAVRAGRLLLDHLAERGVQAVVAHVHPDHHASNSVATRLGLTPTGTVVDGEVRWTGSPA